MDTAIRKVQLTLLKALAEWKESPFALGGGTALELYYLEHRFSRDVDLFTRDFSPAVLEEAVNKFGRVIGIPLVKQREFLSADRARIAFYTADVEEASYPLKVDFIEEVLLDRPVVRRYNGVPVYDVNEIYKLKVYAVSGTGEATDIVGRVEATGRMQARDAFDLYVLSKCVKPLSRFLERLPRLVQRRFVRWARTYSRMDMKLALLDLEIYLKDFDGKEMIRHIDTEVERFIRGLL